MFAQQRNLPAVRLKAVSKITGEVKPQHKTVGTLSESYFSKIPSGYQIH